MFVVMKTSDYVTPTEFAELVGRPYETVIYWIRRGLIPGVVRTEESRGPSYKVPRSAATTFKDNPPARGRPPKAKSDHAAKATRKPRKAQGGTGG